jgi:pyruvate kinase
MRRQRRTKVVATLGPASSERAVISRLFEAGADVFRINMSHTSHDKMRELVATIRAVEADHNRPIGVLVDLQGPKLRLGAFKDDAAVIDKDQDFVFDADPTPGDATRVQLPHPEIFAAIKAGDALLIDDGKLRLLATAVAPQRIVARVEVGGKVSNRKGVSLPDTVIPLAALTPKDVADLEAALNVGVDWVALSFIQRPEDIAEAKKLTRGRAAVMAKIEKPQAVARLADILDLADALMVARGDLGVEMPLEKVPGVQKEMTRACRRAGKPVVVATQMLESMIANPVPTRAEVSDVATAIFDGADAIMLSAESAAGQYPVEAIATMNRIAEAVEHDGMYEPSLHVLRTEPEPTGADAIAAAARQVADTLDLSAIVCWTSSGSTGLRVSRERPRCPIVALSPSETAGRKLSLVWGIHSVIAEDAHDQDDMVERACRLAFKEGFAKAGERVIVVAGVPLGTPGATNMMRIAFVGAGADADGE